MNARIDEVLRALASEDRRAIWDAVEQAGDLLREGTLPEPAHAELGDRLVRLAAHEQWEVRKAVAEAVVELRHESFHSAIARLLEDDNPWVVQAAQRTLARRSELTRTDLLRERHETLLRRQLTELEATHGAAARVAALRVAEKYTEIIVRETFHEFIKVISPLDASLRKLEAALLGSRINAEACRGHVEGAKRRLRLLSAIMTSLRDFTKDVTPEFCAENLRVVIDEAVHMLRDRVGADATGLELEVEVDPAILIDAHRHRLLQAFSNILQNAVEAYDGTEHARRIAIAARTDGTEHVVVTITDQGCGMSDQVRSEAFELFATVKPTGTGFGLPLAQKIIEQEHGGSIDLSSRKGEGTTVKVVLNIEQAQRKQEAQP